MMCHSIVDCFKWFLILTVVLESSAAVADGFGCQRQSDGSAASLVCSDDSAGEGDSVAYVSLRKMPRWGVHAGLTVVDLCIGPRAMVGNDVIDDGPKVDDLVGAKQIASTRTKVCERRYCTDVSRQFSLMINSIPFPVGWTSISFWLGYQQRSFSIRCDELMHSL